MAPRNTGMPLELDLVEEVRVNRSAVERRTATLRGRRTVKKEWQAAWLLRAVTLMDLTTLSGDDTPGRVRRLCAKARRPVRADLLDAMGANQLPIRVGAKPRWPLGHRMRKPRLAIAAGVSAGRSMMVVMASP